MEFEVYPAVPSKFKQNTSEGFTSTKLSEKISPLPNVNKIKMLKQKSQNVATILNNSLDKMRN